MAIILVRVDERQLDARSDHRHGGTLHTQANEAKNNPVGILETSLGLPEDTDERRADEDIGDDGADEPEAGEEVADVVESLVVHSLWKEEGGMMSGEGGRKEEGKNVR